MSAESVTHNLTTRTASGILWLFSGLGLSSIVRFAIVPILARLLSPDDFGLIAAATVVTGLANIFSTIGIGPSIVRSKVIEPRHISTGFTITLVFSLLVGFVVFQSAPWIANFYGRPDLSPIVAILALKFPLSGFKVVSESVLQRELKFRALATYEFTAFLIGYCAVSVLMALLGYGVWSLVFGLLGHVFVKVLLLAWNRWDTMRLGFDSNAARYLISQGSSFTGMNIVNYGASQADYLVVGRVLGMSTLGIYTKAYQLMSRPVVALAQTVSRPLFASVATLQDDISRARLAFARGISISSLAILPVAPLAIILGPEIVRVLLGQNWESAILPFQILSISVYFQFGFRMCNTISQSFGALRGVLFQQILYLAGVTLGALVGLNWGIQGVAAGAASALLLSYLTAAYLVLRTLNLSWHLFLLAHLRGFCLAVLVLLVAYPSAQLLRTQELPIVTLFGVLAIVGLSTLVLIIVAPRLILGSDGQWLMLRIPAVNSLVSRLNASIFGRKRLK